MDKTKLADIIAMLSGENPGDRHFKENSALMVGALMLRLGIKEFNLAKPEMDAIEASKTGVVFEANNHEITVYLFQGEAEMLALRAKIEAHTGKDPIPVNPFAEPAPEDSGDIVGAMMKNGAFTTPDTY